MTMMDQVRSCIDMVFAAANGLISLPMDWLIAAMHFAAARVTAFVPRQGVDHGNRR